jgi:hypothetical protein
LRRWAGTGQGRVAGSRSVPGLHQGRLLPMLSVGGSCSALPPPPPRPELSPSPLPACLPDRGVCVCVAAGLVLLLAKLCSQLEGQTVPWAMDALAASFPPKGSSEMPAFEAGRVARQLGTAASEWAASAVGRGVLQRPCCVPILAAALPPAFFRNAHAPYQPHSSPPSAHTPCCNVRAWWLLNTAPCLPAMPSADVLLAAFVDAHGAKLSRLVRRSITSTNWLQANQPQGPRPVADLFVEVGGCGAAAGMGQPRGGGAALAGWQITAAGVWAARCARLAAGAVMPTAAPWLAGTRPPSYLSASSACVLCRRFTRRRARWCAWSSPRGAAAVSTAARCGPAKAAP